MDKEELQNILKDHELWLESEGEEGEKANFSGANLSEASIYAGTVNTGAQWDCISRSALFSPRSWFHGPSSSSIW